MYTDETLSCTDCSAPFTFSAGEQEFFAQKGFANKPNRCPDCRAARKNQRNGGSNTMFGGGSRPQREMFSATCSGCGQTAQVPFQPRGDRPVYCRDCFAQRPSSYR